MSEGSRMNRDIALSVAQEFINIIKKDVERIRIAGSIRREKDTVGDIEIVCQPIWKNGLNIKMQNLLEMGVIDLNRPRKDNKKNPFGERYYRINYLLNNTAYPIDLFVVLPPAQFAVIYLIRTGSADYSHWFVQQGYKYGIRVIDGHLEQNGKVIDTAQEIDVFDAMHVPYRDPKYREIIK